MEADASASSVRRHAIQAMRLKDGDELQLSDGRGLRSTPYCATRIMESLKCREFVKEAQPVTRLALVQALAKTGHDEQAIDMATQIGVDQVIPWQADRSIAKWKGRTYGHKWTQLLEPPPNSRADRIGRHSWTIA